MKKPEKITIPTFGRLKFRKFYIFLQKIRFNTLIKKKIEFSSHIRKFRMSYMRKGFLIYEEMRKYLTIYEEAVSHI